MSNSQTQSGEACPVDGCENSELEELTDDDKLDWFCHWCGNLFVETEDGLNAQ